MFWLMFELLFSATNIMHPLWHFPLIVVEQSEINNGHIVKDSFSENEAYAVLHLSRFMTQNHALAHSVSCFGILTSAETNTV